MKFLYLVRSSHPFWTNRIDVDYIIKELIRRGHQVDVYDIRERMLIDCNSDTRTYFAKNNTISKIFPLYLLYNFIVFYFFLFRNKGVYDICNILYIREEQLILHKTLAKSAKKIVLSYYGSDFNERNFIKNTFQGLIRNASQITFTSISLIEKFGIYYKGFNPSKLRRLMFPQLRLLPYEEFLVDAKPSFKKKLGIDEKKIVLTLGTNGFPNEQHIALINEIKKFYISDKYHFILPLTYGASREYQKEVIADLYSFVKQEDCIIFNSYLSEEDMLNVRMATDIFINMRLNDQLASSMSESFAANCLIICGKWLPYQVLENDGFQYFTINSMSELSDCVVNTLKMSEMKKNELLNKNKHLIYDKFNVSRDLNEWITFYEKEIWN